MSKAITKKSDPRGSNASALGDVPGPSLRVQSEPTFARFSALVGATLVTVGCVILWMTLIGGRTNLALGPGWGSFLLFVGVCALLLHAVVERDLQFRLVYTAVALAVFGVGVAMCIIPYPTHFGDLFGAGVLALLVALFFVLAVLRNETDVTRRDYVQLAVLGAGAVGALTGLVGSTVSINFLFPYGLLLSLLGLVYLLTFIGSRGVNDDPARYLGWGVFAAGVLTFLVAAGPLDACRLLFHHLKWTQADPGNYFFPTGLIVMVVGVVYAASAYLTCSDAPFAVLTRRELGAYFFTPMAYLLFFGFTAIAWVSFALFFNGLWDAHESRFPVPEPVVQHYFFDILPAIAMLFVVPVLTMRLVSEEKRSGTMEMLLTAPVEEPTVVLSKFLAGWLMFLTIWLPYYLFLIPMAAAGAPFDYRPLLSFTLGLMIVGAGMVSMGLFFSTLTANQLVSAVLTFAGMLCLTAVYIAGLIIRDPNSAWTAVLKHMSFLDSWRETLQGKVTPDVGLLFYAAMAIFFLFLSVKVLESRKWW